MCKSERNTLLRSIKNVCKCKERYCPQPTPPHPITCVASHMCSRPRKVNDVASNVCASQRETSCCVASKMCASARNVTVPNTPPHPITCVASHMCSRPRKVNDVASNMCKSERNILLRSIKHVCKRTERYCPQPTPPHPITCVASHMCSRPRKVNDVASNMCASQRETPCCVASKMCASARNVTVPNPPHPTPSLA